jgi:hypothetical protein
MNQFVFMTLTDSAPCEVRTQILYMIFMNAGSRKMYIISTSESLRTLMATIQATYVYRNIEVCWYNRCWSGKAISITYCEWVCVALGIQHAMRMCLIVICDLGGCKKFCSLSHKRHGFRKKNNLLNIKYILIFPTTLVCNISHFRDNSTRCHKRTVHRASRKLTVITFKF